VTLQFYITSPGQFTVTIIRKEMLCVHGCKAHNIV